LLWLYFWLLIFEGALRRWFLPSLSNLLLLVRDPIALLIVIWAWPLLRSRLSRFWLNPLLVIAPIAFVLASTVGHGDIPTALYGCRILILHLPLIFVYASIFRREDIIRFAWTIVLLSVPMSLLIAAQSSLPETHFLNVGVGGVGTAVFDGAGGRFRPPGTFTFITGVSLFFTLAAASYFVILYGTKFRFIGLLALAIAGIALVVALPVSISRSLLAGYLTVLAATVVSLLLSRSRLTPLISGTLLLVLVCSLATAVPAFRDTADAFSARWDLAAGVDREAVGDLGVAAYQLQNRVLPGFTDPLASLDNVPLAGYGIGIGTNFGSQRLTGERTFLVGEGSWESTLAELGFPLGLCFLIWRVALAFWLLRVSLRSALRGNLLPTIWLGSSFLVVLSGQTGQPTGLGFLVVSAGLTLASCYLNSASLARPVHFS
jgi:hypothetical protein